MPESRGRNKALIEIMAAFAHVQISKAPHGIIGVYTAMHGAQTPHNRHALLVTLNF